MRALKHWLFGTGPGVFLGWFAVLVAAASVAILVPHMSRVHADLAALRAAEARQIEQLRRDLAREVDRWVTDLLSASEGLGTARLLADPAPRARAMYAGSAAQFARLRQAYRQIRLVDAGGMERVGVDLAEGEPHVLDATELESVAAEPYFAAAFALGRGDVFIAPVEWIATSGESGPLVRIATPVFGQQEVPLGVFSLAYDAERMLGRIRQDAVDAQGEIWLLASDGTELVRPETADRRGFAERHAGILERVRAEGAGALLDDAEGLVSFATVTPAVIAANTQRRAGARTVGGGDWLIVNIVPPERIAALTGFGRDNLRHLLLAAYAVCALLAGLLAAVRIARIRSFEALAREEARLRQMANALPVCIAQVDAGLRYVFCNEAFAGLFGRRAEQVAGMRTVELVGESRNSELLPHLEAALRGEHVRYERDQILAEGSLARFEVSYVPRTGPGGGIEGFFVLIIDVTERHRLEQMRADFVSMVSHELRTPVTSIAWAVEMVMDSLAGQVAETARGMLEIARLNAERLLALVNDVLDLRKLESGSLSLRDERVMLRGLLDRSIESLRAYADHHQIGLRLQAEEDLAVNADPARLEQVMANLVSNAVRYSRTGGVVVIGLARHGDRARVSVTDNGEGIPEAFRSRIFGRFAQGDPGGRKGGTGLGLAICKDIVERSGGVIDFSVQPGVGTTFWFELPLAGPAA